MLACKERMKEPQSPVWTDWFQLSSSGSCLPYSAHSSLWGDPSLSTHSDQSSGHHRLVKKVQSRGLLDLNGIHLCGRGLSGLPVPARRPSCPAFFPSSVLLFSYLCSAFTLLPSLSSKSGFWLCTDCWWDRNESLCWMSASTQNCELQADLQSLLCSPCQKRSKTSSPLVK